jgi:hypothetical protein
MQEFQNAIQTPDKIQFIINILLSNSTKILTFINKGSFSKCFICCTIETKYLPDVLDQSLGLLLGGKVSALILLPFKNDIPKLPVPHARRPGDLLGKI